MLVPGQTIERYTVEALIGQGGMAVVYRVRHNQLGSQHALKILTAPKAQVRERLMVEGRAQATMRHPNIVTVTDVIEVDGSPALLMEFVDGPTLEEWLADRPTLSDAEKVFCGICLGVGEAHLRGLVHRDLKPSNVLLAETSGGLVPKVTDFGIAKLLQEPEDRSTRTNMALGTPHYMAPEQIRDAKGVDERADLFSLGCLLYEMVCATKAFGGGDVLTVLNNVAAARYESPRVYVPDLPDRFVRAIDGCLRVDRDARIQDCKSLLAILTEDEFAPPVPRRRDSGLMSIDEFDTPVRRVSTSDRIVATPIDPNANTVPAAQSRVGTPRLTTTGGGELHPSSRKWFGVTAALIVALAGFTAFAWWHDQPSPRRAPDELVLDRARTDPQVPVIPPADPLSLPPAVPPVSDHASLVGTPHPKPADPVASPTSVAPPGPTTPTSDTPPSGFLFSAATVTSGRVVVTGDGDARVTLYQGTMTYHPGELPVGDYDVIASFPGRDQRVGSVHIAGGDVHRVACTAKTCKVQ